MEIRIIRFFLIFAFFVSTLRGNSQIPETLEIKRIPGVAGYELNYDNPIAPNARGSILPEAYSLKKYAPPIGDQMSYGTCVGWATTYAGMTILENIQLNRDGISMEEGQCMSPQLTYDLCKLKYDTICSRGTYVKAALNALVNFGTTTLDQYPYSCKLIDTELNGISRILIDTAEQTQMKNVLASARKKRLSGFISAGGPNIVQNVKYYLSRNMPVIISAEMYNSLERNSVSGVWNGAMDNYLGGHAMCVVGYDDSKEGGAFEILNSWGEDWSAGGYIWFRYNDFAKVVDEAYALSGIDLNNDSIKYLNNYSVNLTAIGKESSKTLKITSRNSEFLDFDFKIGGYSNKLIIEYPHDEHEFFLSIENLIDEGFYVYGFTICCGGQISLINSTNGISKFYQGKGQGLIIPTQQQTGIKLDGYYGGKNEICILLCKKEIQAIELEESLMKSYTNLLDFVRTNFTGRVSVNSFYGRTLLSGRFRLDNNNEINDIQPIFLGCEQIKIDDSKDDLVFRNVEIVGTEIPFLNYDLSTIKKGFLGETFNLKIQVQKRCFPLRRKNKVRLSIEELDTENLDIFSESKKKTLIKFKSNQGDLSKKIKAEIFQYLLLNDIDFYVN